MLQNEIVGSSNQQMYRYLGAALLVYITLSVLAGMPAAANLTAFVIGLIVLFVVLLALSAFSWYLLYKPLPENYKIESTSPISKTLRQGLAMLLFVSSILGMVGGLWDVAWHTSYGLPFGPDFFWRPHQFIYVALFTPILVAGFIWVQTIRNGKGTLQQRFRADMPLSILMLGGIFMATILPMDPVWHLIYAEDITGLSVPHTLFSVANTIIYTGYLSILVSYTARRKNWQGVWKANFVDMVIAFVGTSTLVTVLIVAAGDWEMVMSNTEVLPRLPSLVAARPDWALIAMLSFTVGWLMTMVHHSTKLYGIASVSLIMGIVVRQSLFFVLKNGFDGSGTWLVLCPLIISLDVMAWLGASKVKQFAVWMRALALTAAGTVISLPLINVFYRYPSVSLSNAPFMVIAMFIAASVGIWFGEGLGTFIGSSKREEENPLGLVILPNVVRLSAAVLLVLILFAVWFISTSAAPVL